MIVFILACNSCGHSFEGWFRDGTAWETQSAGGKVQCPACGSPKTAKAPMAPAVHGRKDRPKSNDAAEPDKTAPNDRTTLRTLLRAIRANAEDVGDRMEKTVRAMEAGEEPERPVIGNLTDKQTETLLAEGFPIIPLPNDRDDA